VAIEWSRTFKVNTWGKTKGMTPEQLGYTPADEPMTPQEFRARVEQALISGLGSGVIDPTPDKHIDVAAGSNTLEADAIPCFSLNRYDAPFVAHDGHRIYPKSGRYVDNFPRQNLENGNSKDRQTGGRYKEMVRCAKRLIGELVDDQVITRDYPGYLTECLVYNVPIDRFGNYRRYDDLNGVFDFLWHGLKEEEKYLKWTEPSELLMVFRGRPDRKPSTALTAIDRAWRRLVE
jgi:hypothetical protein